MDENRFDDVITNLPDEFKVPDPPLEEMWKVIEAAHFTQTRRFTMRSTPWLAAAAALLIGIGIGRYYPSGKTATASSSATPIAIRLPNTSARRRRCSSRCRRKVVLRRPMQLSQIRLPICSSPLDS